MALPAGHHGMEQSAAHWWCGSFTPVTIPLSDFDFFVCDRERWERGKLNVWYAVPSLVRCLGVGVSSEVGGM